MKRSMNSWEGFSQHSVMIRETVRYDAFLSFFEWDCILSGAVKNDLFSVRWLSASWYYPGEAGLVLLYILYYFRTLFIFNDFINYSFTHQTHTHTHTHTGGR